ncbi:nitrite reductase small subunit NirD [Pseudonocardia sp. N23]|uniref:nitrite reductase small subunit NirD n=1 Tax=Pseudonocardia sp. N23 TaxID=1987376 RepID=UPI000BFD0C87|nr:nitrite reductase small subunit NirD [Pseudonocardia sp. N23]GAY07053.1 nitrite reductase small subunit [Pseudonocardia sp. N23]
MTAVVVTVWTLVCRVDQLEPERGAAALLDGRQVALFRTHEGTVHAIDNLDPCSGAAVLSRGIVGDRGGVPTVASPVYKQVFSLLDGTCLDEPEVRVDVHEVRIRDGIVEIATPWAGR